MQSVSCEYDGLNGWNSATRSNIDRCQVIRDSISVHAVGEMRDLQQYALFDNFVGFAASLIMM